MFRKTNSNSIVSASIISSLIFVLPVLFYSQALGAQQAGPDISILKVSSEGITVQFTPPKSTSGTLEAELHEIDGKLMAKVTRQHKGKPIEVELFGQINEKDLGNYYLRYRFSSGDEFQQRSLLFAGEILETTVLGQREFVAGTQPLIRILVKDHSTGVPIQGATVSAELLEQDKTISKFTSKTDKYGEAAAKLQMPDSPMNNLKLKILVTTKNSKDTIEETIQVRSSLRTLLTTDKPLYQPGQTIHIRSLTLSGEEMKPLSEAQVVFEVEDSKGNKVFKSSKKTDEYGIGFTDFVLADELNMGTYRVRAIVAGVKEEKTVNIERYVLPKFKINFKSDRNFYQPGETVKGEIQVDYFFGKPVALGKVQINCAKFDVEYTDFQTIEGKTDDKGHYSFEVKLPEHFAGQPFEAGKASAKFEIKVTDTADHKETITKNISVTASPIIIAAVPESGDLTPDLENKIYIVTTYADSKPAKCKVTWQNAPDGKPVVIETDEAGFGEVTLKPQEGQSMRLNLTAKDTQGSSGRAEVELKVKEKIDDDWILLRTNKSLYRTGEQVELSVFTTRKTGTVYIDLIKDKQTNLTKTLELKNGKTSDKVTLDASLAGTIQINAYLIGKNGVIVRDQRLLLVDPADDLSISITSDSETYLPGGNANLKFKVTNKKGKGTAAALGVMVVDEAVFALQEMQPGLEKVYFYLEKEIATPRYEIHGYELDQCIMPPPPDVDIRAEQKQRDTAAKVLLASAKGVGEYSLNINTYQRDNRAQMFLQKMSPLMFPRYQKIQEALNKFSQDHRKLLQKHFKDAVTLDTLVREGYCKQADVLDPWNVAMKINGQWSEQDQAYYWWFLSSAGIDGKWDTADDFSAQWNYVFEGKDKKDLDRALILTGRLEEFEMNGGVRRGGFA